MNKTATNETWKNVPIDNPKKIDIDLLFTEKQFSKLKNGLIPQQMEDKWGHKIFLGSDLVNSVVLGKI